MNSELVRAFQAERLKKRRSLASWLVILGSFFTPAVVILARLVHPEGLPELYLADTFWTRLWRNSWESMAIFFLPMGAILATSLITQLEFKNNAWKQVHALPLSLSSIFLAKLGIILSMMVQFFVLFNVAVYASAVVPWLLLGGISYPLAPLPWRDFLLEDLRYFVACLPIIGLQFLISLQFRNFLVPVGIGFLAWVGALASLPWKYGFVLPYTHCMLEYLKADPGKKVFIPQVSISTWSLGYFLLFSGLGFLLFALKKDRG